MKAWNPKPNYKQPSPSFSLVFMWHLPWCLIVITDLPCPFSIGGARPCKVKKDTSQAPRADYRANQNTVWTEQICQPMALASLALDKVASHKNKFWTSSLLFPQDTTPHSISTNSPNTSDSQSSWRAETKLPFTWACQPSSTSSSSFPPSPSSKPPPHSLIKTQYKRTMELVSVSLLFSSASNGRCPLNTAANWPSLQLSVSIWEPPTHVSVWCKRAKLRLWSTTKDTVSPLHMSPSPTTRDLSETQPRTRPPQTQSEPSMMSSKLILVDICPFSRWGSGATASAESGIQRAQLIGIPQAYDRSQVFG